MSASEKIILPGLLRAELEALANCLVAEHCWDQARWAIEAYAWRFDGLERVPRTGGTA